MGVVDTIIPENPFLKFWNEYPKKHGKLEAKRAFSKHVKCDVEKVISALRIHKRLPQWQDRQFIPRAATWLNQERWEDEITADDIYGQMTEEQKTELYWESKRDELEGRKVN